MTIIHFFILLNSERAKKSFNYGMQWVHLKQSDLVVQVKKEALFSILLTIETIQKLMFHQKMISHTMVKHLVLKKNILYLLVYQERIFYLIKTMNKKL